MTFPNDIHAYTKDDEEVITRFAHYLATTPDGSKPPDNASQFIANWLAQEQLVNRCSQTLSRVLQHMASHASSEFPRQ